MQEGWTFAIRQTRGRGASSMRFMPLMTKAEEKGLSYNRRVYPLDAQELTEEQIAVAFAMTSRRPEPFDEIARQVSQEKAADFHERWVLGYGHASVAEHAVVHLAVENISRLACDTLEDNRLASYTEKSSRYQLLPEGYFFEPAELQDQPYLGEIFRVTCRELFQHYHRFVDGCIAYLQGVHPRQERERDSAYNVRLRRIATDSCRAVLPAATLTNVGVTANARVLEHAISKLMSSELAEERDLGLELRTEGHTITPTLIKYAERNPYLSEVHEVQQDQSHWFTEGMPTSSRSKDRPTSKDRHHSQDIPPSKGGAMGGLAPSEHSVSLVAWSEQAEEKLAAALLYRRAHRSYDEVWRQALDMTSDERQELIRQCVAEMGPHDSPVREFELVDYTYEFVLDYGAYREFKRHRMQSYVPQTLTVAQGYGVPELLVKAGLGGQFLDAIGRAEEAYWQVHEFSPVVAQYLVTHAHYRRVLTKLNLRECYHLFKLRTSSLAHFSIRDPMMQAMKLAVETHPGLFRHLQLRDFPDWWPFAL